MGRENSLSAFRQGGGQGDGMSVRSDRLSAQKLKEGSHKDKGPHAEDVCAHKAGAVGTASPGHTVKNAYRLLQQHLELPRHVPEFGDDKNPDQGGGQQEDRRNEKRGDHPGIDGLKARQADPVDVVQHRVPHGLLYGFRAARRPGEQRSGQQEQDRRKPQRQTLFVLFHSAFLLSVVYPCARRAHIQRYNYTTFVKSWNRTELWMFRWELDTLPP